MTRTLSYAALALASGLLIPALAALSGGLGRVFGSPAWASVLLLAVGLLAALAFASLARAPLPSWSAAAAAPPLTYAAGTIVAFYILMATFLAPRFGVANTVMLVLLAQLVLAEVIDRFGLFGAAPRLLDATRVIGLATLVWGVVLCQWRR